MFKQYHNKLIFPDFYQRFLTNIMHERYEEVDCYSKHKGEAPHFSFIGSLWHNIWYCETQNFLSKCIFRSFFCILWRLIKQKNYKLFRLKNIYIGSLSIRAQILSAFLKVQLTVLSLERPHHTGRESPYSM